MSEIHTYVPGDNGCQARVRVPSMVGSRPSTTSMWCGLPERSPYHHEAICTDCNHPMSAHLDGCHVVVGELTCRCNATADIPREAEDDFLQCPHEVVRATCAGACMCPCVPCAPSRATADER